LKNKYNVQVLLLLGPRSCYLMALVREKFKQQAPEVIGKKKKTNEREARRI